MTEIERQKFEERYDKNFSEIRNEFKKNLKEMGYCGNLDEINDGRDEFVESERKESR